MNDHPQIPPHSRESGGVTIKTIAFPLSGCEDAEQLYFRTRGQPPPAVDGAKILLRRGGIVSTDTYFNVLSANFIRKHTHVQEIGLRLHVRGKCRLRTYRASLAGAPPELADEVLIESGSAEDQAATVAGIDPGSLADVAFFELEAIDDLCEFRGAEYLATRLDSAPNRVAIAYSTTVYRREGAFRANRAAIEDYFRRRPALRDAYRFFVVDNGRTLDDAGPLFTLLCSKNFGGSGGCARAMLEVLGSESEFTHFVISDDDILLDPSVLENLFYILRVLGEPAACIGASMLRMERKCVQFEKGGRVEGGRFVPVKTGLDLSRWDALLANEVEERVDYGAWWFFCVPVSRIRGEGLPLPMFVKWDDVEYSARLGGPILFPPAVAVWHESVERKDEFQTPLYFATRNRLIYYAIRPGVGLGDAIRLFVQLCCQVLWGLCCFRYRNVGFIHAAIADFLAGPQTAFGADPEDCLRRIARYRYTVEERATVSGEKARVAGTLRVPSAQVGVGSGRHTECACCFTDRSRLQERERPAIPGGSASRLRGLGWRLVQLATFNGHLLPRWLSRTKVFVPAHIGDPLATLDACFAAATVVFLAQDGSFEVQRSLRRFLAGAARSSWYLLLLLLKGRAARRSYRERWRSFTCPSAWRELLGLTVADTLLERGVDTT